MPKKVTNYETALITSLEIELGPNNQSITNSSLHHLEELTNSSLHHLEERTAQKKKKRMEAFAQYPHFRPNFAKQLQ